MSSSSLLACPSPPQDCISSVSFVSNPSTGTQFLCCGSWDNKVYCWEVPVGTKDDGTPLVPIPRPGVSHSQPVLSVSGTQDGHIFSGGCDNVVKKWKLGASSNPVLGTHDEPVSSVRVAGAKQPNVVVSGSWDKTAKVWDIRQPPCSPVHTFELPEKVYDLDVQFPLAVFVTADRGVVTYHLTEGKAVASGYSKLRFQTRCVTCFADGSGYAMGSIEGRVSVFPHYDQTKRFTFRCHRKGDADIYPVNSIISHPDKAHSEILATGGGDGLICQWNRRERKALSTFPATANAARTGVSSICWNHDASMLGFSVSPDLGTTPPEQFDPTQGNGVYVKFPKFHQQPPQQVLQQPHITPLPPTPAAPSQPPQPQ